MRNKTTLTAMGRRVLALLLAVALLAASCSGDSEPDEQVGAPTVSEGVADASVPFEIEAFGDLARPVGESIVATFGAAGGSLEVDDDTLLIVPTDAFATATEVTVAVFELAFGDYVTDPPSAAVYVVSTVDDVALATPVLLEIDRPADTQTVLQYSDGEWPPVAAAAGEKTLVPITHFSAVSTVVASRTPTEAASLVDVAPGATDAEFLRTCIWAVIGIYGGLSSVADESDIEFAGNFAYSVCATALVDRSTPDGRRVSTACVGDKIDGDTNFREAIDECLADQDAEEAVEPDPTSEVDETPTESASQPEPSGPVQFTGSATTGSIETGPSDDLLSVNFIANVEASTVTIDATIVIHHWFRGGPEAAPFEDQNCGVTYEHGIHFEGPSGNPTVLRGTVDASTILEVQGVLCDGDDDQRRLLEVGDMVGRFEGKANGLGVDGEFTLDFRSVAVSSGG